MTDLEKERIYKEAVGFLTSSLTNDETVEASLKALESLGDYKDARDLFLKYSKIHEAALEEKAELDKRRNVTRKLQWLLMMAGLAVATVLIVILVYALRNPPWR